jgi:hypothetical protein
VIKASVFLVIDILPLFYHKFREYQINLGSQIGHHHAGEGGKRNWRCKLN